VLLVDAAWRVLLLRGCDPARPHHRYWFTVGGGLDDGETPVQGAVRELFEETGLRVDPAALGEPVFHDVTEFPFDGRWYRQDQEFYLVQVRSWQVDFAGFNAIERATVDAHRWWSTDELRATDERFYPLELPDLLDGLSGAFGPPAVDRSRPGRPEPSAPPADPACEDVPC
jgi:8-oxo-dGTP pyrophosphatase MutT (NUDIX family)